MTGNKPKIRRNGDIKQALMRQLLIATTNRGKLPEIREIMATSSLEIICLEDALRLGLLDSFPAVVEDGGTFEANALKKAIEIMRRSGVTTLADDSGLEIDFLGGQPGVDSAYFMGLDTPYSKRNAHIIEVMRGADGEARSARFVCVIAVAFADGRTFTARGECAGRIAYKPMGDGGFGYDPIFFVPQLGKTFGQLSSHEKNAVSHRAAALRNIKDLLSRKGLCL